MKANVIPNQKSQIFGDQNMIRIPKPVCWLGHATPIAILIFYLLITCTVSMPPKNEKLQPVTPSKYWDQSAQASFPVSFDDFRQMVCTTTVFVDKTLLIRDLMDEMQQVILVNRPRRWGKSMTINMLCRFFSREVDANGQPLKTQPDRVLFEGGVTCIGHHNNQKKQVELRPLKIASEKGYMDFQGTYPVIYMSWKDVKKKTFFLTKIALSQVIGEVFKKHKYLLQSQSKKITSEEKQQFQKWQKDFKAIEDGFYKNQKEMELIRLQNALVLLCQLLDKHHGRKVIILIDEYDTPFNQMLIHEVEVTERNKVVQMISEILQKILKGRFDIVKKAVLTGIHNTLLKQAASGLNNVQVYRITDHQLGEHFGFSKEEIQEQLISKMFKTVGNTQPQDVREALFDKISQWYNGYKVPLGNKGYRQTYNPFAVVKYLNECVERKLIVDGKCYWTESGSHIMIHKFFDFGRRNKKMELAFELDTKEPIILKFKQSINLSKIKFYDESYLTQLLIDTGYITGYVDGVDGDIFRATIPNLEVSKVFRNQLKAWLKTQSILDCTFIDVQNKKEFVQKIQKAFEQLKKYIGNYNEAIFSHIITTRILSADKKKDEQYSVSIEKHSGDGIMDSLFLPLKAKRPQAAVINEYKYTDRPQQEKRLHTQALWQIYEKNYMNDVLEQSTTNKLIERIVTRPIIIISDQPKQSIKIYAEEDISHTIEEARKITDFFKRDLQKAKRQKTKDKQQRRIRLLKQYQAKDLRELLQVICQTKLQSSIKEPSLQNEKGQNTRPLNYFKVLWNLPHIFQRDIFPRINDRDQKQHEWTETRQRFTRKFPDEQSLERATLDQVFQVVYQKQIAEVVFSKLQQMKRDPEYRMKDNHDFKRLDTPVRNTDRQVLTLLVEPDPLQEAFNRIDFSAKQMILRAKQQALKKGEAQVNTKGQSSAAKAKVLLDPFLQVNEKLINQARHYERTGTLFQSFGRGLLEGAIRLFSEGVQLSMFGNPVSGVNGLILGMGQAQNEGEVKRMID